MKISHVVGLALFAVGCSNSSKSEAPPLVPGLMNFEGSFDAKTGKLSVHMMPKGGAPGEASSAVTLPYGTGSGQAYLNTNQATVAWNAPDLTGDVRAVNNLVTDRIDNFTAFIDNLTTGVTWNGPFNYGSVNAGEASGYITWQFNNPGLGNFTFVGHIEGDIATTDVQLIVNGDPTGAIEYLPRETLGTAPNVAATGSCSGGNTCSVPGADTSSHSQVRLRPAVNRTTVWNSGCDSINRHNNCYASAGQTVTATISAPSVITLTVQGNTSGTFEWLNRSVRTHQNGAPALGTCTNTGCVITTAPNQRSLRIRPPGGGLTTVWSGCDQTGNSRNDCYINSNGNKNITATVN